MASSGSGDAPPPREPSPVKMEGVLRGYDEIGKHAGFRFQCRQTACGFESHYPYHVGASDILLAPTFYKSQSVLILPLLLFKSNPLLC